MDKQSELSDGAILIWGAILMTIPMASHPHSKAAEGLLKVPASVFSINIFTHAVAMLSLPAVLFGFWSFTKWLNSKLARFAFTIITFGMFAVICAATFDGFVSSGFINRARPITPDANQIQLLMTFNSSIVQSFSLVYMFSVCIAVVLWSVIILISKTLPKWIGYYGIVMASAAMVASLSGFVLVDFVGIKIFVLGFVTWTFMLGMSLRRVDFSKQALNGWPSFRISSTNSNNIPIDSIHLKEKALVGK